MRVLRLVLRIGPTSGPYNQLTLPTIGRFDTTICTYFPHGFPTNWRADERLEYVEGDGRASTFIGHLRRLLRERPIDVVHVHSPHLGSLLHAAAFPHWSRIARRSVMTLHSSYGVYRRRNRVLLWPSFLTMSKLVCCGNASLDSLPAWLRSVGGRRLCSIANGVDLTRVDRARAAAANGGPLNLISVGSLRSLKNHVAVIRALSRAGRPEIKLTIVGGGHGETLLRREIDGSGMARQVELTGQLSRDETLRRLWQADAFISLSQGEGLPIAVLEAMACHCPVILSDIPPHREVAGQCEGACLVNGEELNAIVERIRCLLTLTPKRRVECGNACRRRVEARFSLARTLDQYEQLYRSMNSRRDGEMVTRRHENAQKAEGRVVASQ